MGDLSDELKNITATSADYTQLVAVTEATNFDMIASRLSDRAMLRQVSALLLNLAIIGDEADVIKKFIFYDKPGRSLPDAIDSDVLDYSEDQKKRLLEVDSIRLLHSLIGMVTESAGELAPVLIQYLETGDPIDWVNVAEELGDCLWYVGLGTNLQNQHTGQTFNDILTRNIRKLATRYGKKFSERDAKNRDLDAERKVLEGETYIVRNFSTGDVLGRTSDMQVAMTILRKESASSQHSVGLEIA